MITNHPLSNDYNVLALAAPAITAAAAPEQFVIIKTGPGLSPLLQHPFSVFKILRDAHNKPTDLTILSKRINISTSQIYDARPKQQIDYLGPLGRPFTMIDVPIETWMVADDVELAPFATLAQSLRARSVQTTLFYSARHATDLFYLDFFRELDVELMLTTEDSNLSERERMIAPLDRRLTAQPPASTIILYTCGPEGMLAATARTTMKYNRPCQMSVERIMSCDLDSCYSCVVPMRDKRSSFHHIRSCIAKPVLTTDQIM